MYTSEAALIIIQPTNLGKAEAQTARLLPRPITHEDTKAPKQAPSKSKDPNHDASCCIKGHEIGNM